MTTKDRTIYELQPIPSRRPTQIEASSQKELKAALQDVLKLGDKEARSAAYLLDAGGSITMPTWTAKPIGVLQFAPLETTPQPRKKKKKVQQEQPEEKQPQQPQQPQPQQLQQLQQTDISQSTDIGQSTEVARDFTVLDT